MCTPLSAGGVEPSTKLSKRGGLTGPQLLEGGLLRERGVTFFRGVQFSHNKLKSEIFNGKKVYKQKYFSLSQLRIQTGKFEQRI